MDIFCRRLSQQRNLDFFCILKSIVFYSELNNFAKNESRENAYMRMMVRSLFSTNRPIRRGNSVEWVLSYLC